jgi:EmrB/QacA subfamily drug resistance transporter
LQRTVPLILAVALFMENMDSTVISTSLPAIAADIGTSAIALKLALTSYLVALAVFIPISGWMADRFGAKHVFRAAIAVFVLGSIACAISGSLFAFVASRTLQGIGGAMMTPLARLVLVRATPRNDLVGAMAWLTVPGLIGPLVGPPIGGFITTYFTWHWIFLINVPIGLAGIWLAGRFLPDVEVSGAQPLDFPGFLLSGLAASGVVFGLSVVSLPALPPSIGAVTLAVGLVAALLYARHATRAPFPILNLRLFKSAGFRSAVLGGSLFRIGNGAVPFLLPLMLQLGFGMTPFQSGMLTFATAFGAIGMKFIAQTVLRLGGFRNVLVCSGLLASLLVAAHGLFTAQTPVPVILVVLVAAGFLRSLFFTATNALVFADIDDRQASQATAIAAVFQQISVAVGVAIGGGILEIEAHFQPGGLSAEDFSSAFFIVAAIAASSAVPFSMMPGEVGRTVSGHRRAGLQEERRAAEVKISRAHDP